VLILDEPTNDLDMDTLDMLQDMLAQYDGTLIIVSHDRDFLDRTVTEILAFEGDAIVESHIGGYSDYIARKKKVGSGKLKVESEKSKSSDTATSNFKLSTSSLTYGEEIELQKLPDKITQLENKLEAMKEELDDPTLYSQNPERFDQLMADYTATKQSIADAEERWLLLEAKRS
jgi:ABC transport system ATP-binding/permease protein